MAAARRFGGSGSAEFGPNLAAMKRAPRPVRGRLVRAAASLLAAAVTAGVGALPGSRSRAADPQPYTVAIAKTQDAALDTALEGSSQLAALRTKAPVGPFGLFARARDDGDRFLTVLKSFGYYNGSVQITIGGHRLDQAGLVDVLQAAPASPPVPVQAAVTPGPIFHLRRVSLQGTYPPGFEAKLGLAPGAPAAAAPIVAARERMLAALRGAGYALAKVELEPATLYPQRELADVTYRVTSGPQVDIGPIAFQGLDGVHEGFARRMLKVHEGDRFSPSALDQARADFGKLPIFASVIARPATRLDPQGTLPITFFASERPLHAVDVGASYSTDLGIGLTAGWHHRNLFGNAEQLNLTAAFQGGGNAQLRPGYRVNAQLIKPGFLNPDQSLETNVGAVKQSLIAYDQTALLESVVINRTLSPHWSASVGVSGEQEEIRQEGVSRRYNLVGLPLTLRYDSTNSLLNPTRGIRAALMVTPEQSLTAPQATFIISQLSGSTYLDLSGNGRSVVALRGLVGTAFGANEFSLPPDQRFYAGGSGTVRGYKFQSVGPQFGDGRPIGGTRITAGTVEFRQRLYR
ncbi:MAG: BamA/TamA family outer membrane protein, partial [Pseudomonadota bacterium]|nr:BamA/TamA family outer membrane protein [Pseudomonadota bacterium]